MKVLVTGAAGFIAGYLIDDLLQHGYEVVGLDNYSKYGVVEKSYQQPPALHVRRRRRDGRGLDEATAGPCDHLIAWAARIGGISYFHEYAYDLLAENERIIAATFDAAIEAFRAGRLKKITVLSSSMVFENATQFPTPESHLGSARRRSSTYGFQKLACEYFAKGAWEQYKLPFTIVRPFNCVGIGEQRALGSKRIPSGNVTLAMSHVVPDLVQKDRSEGKIRCTFWVKATRCGIIPMAAIWPAASACAWNIRPRSNEDFNLSTPMATSVRELAELIWKRLRGERAVPDGFRSGLSARRAVSLAGREQGGPGLGIPGDHDARSDARRGHSLDRAGSARGAILMNGAAGNHSSASSFRSTTRARTSRSVCGGFGRRSQSLPHEILVCYDFDADATLPAIQAMSDCPPSLRLVKNDLGRGVAYALQARISGRPGRRDRDHDGRPFRSARGHSGDGSRRFARKGPTW